VLTIAWDVDDVLNDLTRLWLTEAWCPTHPSAPAYEALTQNPPDAVLGVSLASYLASLDKFRHTPAYVDQAPVSLVHEWFRDHGEAFRHLALTAVPLHAAGQSAAWVIQHFGRWIRSFNFVPSPRVGDPPPPPERDKAAWLAWSGVAHVLVDDSDANVGAARELGMTALLFPRPWNADSGRPVSDLLAELESLSVAGHST
jgi:hypothetical protein